jgi:LDH2 family malate/lactate/ureidoglycolate dehydrogenase
MAMRQDCLAFCVSGHLIGETRIQGEPPWNPLGNPPMSFAIPSGDEAPLILDMGTSFFEQADYHATFERMPAAFFKSLGLVGTAMVMGGALAGMMDPAFQTGQRQYSSASYGAFIVVVDIGRFAPVDAFKAEMDRSMKLISHLPPMKGYDRYAFPGGPEHEREKAWAKEGIPLGETHRKGLEDIADKLGVEIPWR